MPCLLQTAPVFGLSRGSLPEYGHSPLVECLHSSLDRTCACSAVIAPAPLLSHSGLRFVLTCVAAYSCLLMGVLCCSFHLLFCLNGTGSSSAGKRGWGGWPGVSGCREERGEHII